MSAEEHFNRARGLDKKDPRSYVGMALLHMKKENFKFCDNLSRQSIIFERAGFDIAIVFFQTQGEYALNGGILPLDGRIPATNLISSYLYALYLLLITEGLPATPSRKSRVAHKLGSLLPFQLRQFLAGGIRLMYKVSGAKLFLWVIPAHYFKRLGSIKLYGMTLKIPSPVKHFLQYHYGEDWKTPKRDWI